MWCPEIGKQKNRCPYSSGSDQYKVNLLLFFIIIYRGSFWNGRENLKVKVKRTG